MGWSAQICEEEQERQPISPTASDAFLRQIASAPGLDQEAVKDVIWKKSAVL
jgi:hypothetical protein